MRLFGRILASIGGITLAILGIAGCQAYHESQIAAARAIGHATGFVDGFSLGLRVGGSPQTKPNL